MCYYATTDYKCGDWKWGNMKLRCPRQHRMGETCGAKLVHHESVTKTNEDCRLCQEIKVKQRRLQKELDNISRWSKEGNRFSASIEKAQREAKQLEDTIRDLYNRRPSVMMKHNGQARGLGPGSAIPASAPASVNTYQAAPGYTDQHPGGYGSGQPGGYRVSPRSDGQGYGDFY